MEEDWNLLVSLFPEDWREMALRSCALKGLRQNKDEEKLLRTLLLHVGCGYSLRETVARAREARLADLSDVALLKRLRKSEQWLHALCVGLLREKGIEANQTGRRFRLIDGTLVKEPGKTGSLWRVHYSLQWPSLHCDYFKLTSTEGEGTGESLKQFPLLAGEYVLADRGYSHGPGIHYAAERGAYLTVRLNPQGVRIQDLTGQPLPLLKKLEGLKRAGQIGSWPAMVPGDRGQMPVRGKIYALRKSAHAIEKNCKKLKRRGSQDGTTIAPETFLYARYVTVFSTFPEEEFSARETLDIYRVRWQMELVFKRLKQLTDLGHVPKYEDQSARSWLYGKLFMALLAEKLATQAESLSPWGYDLAEI